MVREQDATPFPQRCSKRLYKAIAARRGMVSGTIAGFFILLFCAVSLRTQNSFSLDENSPSNQEQVRWEGLLAMTSANVTLAGHNAENGITYRIKAKSLHHPPDALDLTRMQEVDAMFSDLGGRVFFVSASEADYDQNNATIYLRDNVTMRRRFSPGVLLMDAAVINTADSTIDSIGVATYKRDQTTIVANSLHYDGKQDQMYLENGVTLRKRSIAPQESSR